jgi:hypothetical protein
MLEAVVLGHAPYPNSQIRYGTVATLNIGPNTLFTNAGSNQSDYWTIFYNQTI